MKKAKGGRRKAETNSPLPTPHSPLRCHGFTLLEIVLALGLASLLLAALYTALQMHWSSSALGHVEMERSQVARALFRRIETDLRAVVFRDAALSSSTDDGSSTSSTSTSSSTTSSSGTSTTSSSGSGTSSGSTSSGSTGSTSSTSSTGSTSTSTTTENYSTQKTGLYGDSQSIVAHVSLPSRATSLSSTSSGYAGSDMQSVAYFLAGSNSPLAQQLATSATGPRGQTVGLARLQGDRMAMQAADESGDLSTMASGVKLLAPEVASISFEYFDGVSWTSTWDSGTSNSIPNAVRVTIEFLPPVTTGGWYSRPVSASTDRFQHTVALPLAQPYVPEDSL